MLAEERRKRILELLAENGSVTVAALSELFAVVPITVRRDLELLEKERMLVRTHGGAVLHVEPFLDRPLTAKETLNQEVKMKIAQTAASLVNNGETIILDEGSTCIEVARALRSDKNITVVTNGIKVALELTPYTNITTILIGGVCGHQNFVAYGHETIDSFAKIRAHKYFMGIDALVSGHGISDGDPHQVQLKRTKAASSQTVIGVADQSKLGKIAVAYVGPAGMMNRLIMNAPVPESFKRSLSEERVELIEVQ
ncbi:DeoR family transcriptional regulator [Hydrogenispora ethanolica]|uniref:DeoR family transcriptional regulator n=1 Tax=Hydrogenispora ethanolica TaxID=1082276 RepID=A0A4R1R5V9_HYDET|nr:DeoR/GlpR family DNA-binding transcription regulator [Hydrogenispora ethanolica]TCL60868.1 DeoR family transcriptional regulator [Hydrogenispora ethanolica]